MSLLYTLGYRNPRTKQTWRESLVIKEEMREYGIKIKARVVSRDYQEGCWQEKRIRKVCFLRKGSESRHGLQG